MWLAARALRLGPPGRYALQAAIAVEHVTAARPSGSRPCTTGSPRWPTTRSSSSTAPSPSRSPETSNGGLAHIDALTDDLDRYHYFHAARADVLRRLGEREPAARAYERARALAGNAAERAFLERRLEETR